MWLLFYEETFSPQPTNSKLPKNIRATNDRHDLFALVFGKRTG